MANYIGNQIPSGEFKKLDNISSLFDDSTTSFNLTFGSESISVGSAEQIQVSVNGVIQEPLVSYTLGTGGSQINFASAPPSGASCFITLYGGIGGTNTPSDNSVTDSKLVTGAIENKLGYTPANETTVNSALALKADSSSVPTDISQLTDNTALFDDKADKSNVLELNNTVAYSPTSNYHPATKAYVDALASSGGGNVAITQGFTFAGDGSTTTFDCGSADSYILGALDVYHNGLQLDGSDYTAADGQTFTLTSLTPASGDIIKLVAYGGADVYNKTQTDTLLDGKLSLGGGTMTGVINFANGGQATDYGFTFGDAIADARYLARTGGYNLTFSQYESAGTAWADRFKIKHLGGLESYAHLEGSDAINDEKIQLRLQSDVGANISILDIATVRDTAGSTWSNTSTMIQQKIDSTFMGYIKFNGDTNGAGVSIGSGTSTGNRNDIADSLIVRPGGQVNLPRQPKFRVSLTSQEGQVVANEGVVVFNGGGVGVGSVYNPTNNYNTSNGRFTAPVSGFYHFDAIVRYDGAPNTSTYARIRPHKNGSHMEYIIGDAIMGTYASGQTYNSAKISFSVELAAGDYIDIRWGCSSGSSITVSNSGFSGYLIG